MYTTWQTRTLRKTHCHQRFPIGKHDDRLKTKQCVSYGSHVDCIPASYHRLTKKGSFPGAIGQIRHLSADFGFQTVYNPKSRLFDPALAGGSLLDVGIYPLFIALLLMGVPESIEAKATIAPTGVDSDCTVLLSYTNGATASLYSSIACHTDTKCEIYGTAGKITIPGRFHEQDHYILKKDDHEKQIHCSKTGLGYWHEINHVIECLLSSKKESDIIPLDFSLKMIKMMDEIREIIGVKYAT